MPDDASLRLSRIDTLWSLVRRAHQGAPGDAAALLFARYGGAVHRYLRATLRDPEAADDLFQEFALRVVRGDFRNADPGKGRFRDYLKAAVYRLTVDHHRRAAVRSAALTADVPDGAAPDPGEGLDAAFLAGWREQLLDRTWAALADLERETDQPHHTVLRLRADRPNLSGEEFAAAVGERVGRPYAAAAARQALHRAREKFADLLLEEVRQSLGAADNRLEEELADVGLLGYCRSALARRGRA